MSKLLMASALLLLVALAGVTVPARSGTETCVGCRAQRLVTERFEEVETTAIEPGPCARWVAEAVPGHLHAWRQTGRWVDPARGVDVQHAEPDQLAVPAGEWLTFLRQLPDADRLPVLERMGDDGSAAGVLWAFGAWRDEHPRDDASPSTS